MATLLDGFKDFPYSVNAVKAGGDTAEKHFKEGRPLRAVGAVGRGALAGIGGGVVDAGLLAAAGVEQVARPVGRGLLEVFNGAAGTDIPATDTPANVTKVGNRPQSQYELGHSEIMRPGFSPFGVIQKGDKPGGLMTDEALKAAAGATKVAVEEQTKRPKGLRAEPTQVEGVYKVNGMSSPMFTDDPLRAAREQGRGGFMSVDLAGSNASLARANEIRGSIGAGSDGAPRGGVIGSGREERDPYQSKIDDILRQGANSRAKRAMLSQLVGAQQAALDRSQRGVMKEGDQSLEAQKLRQLEEMGLRRDALSYAQLEQGDRQFQAGAGLRQAQTLNNLAEARSRLSPKSDNSGTKFLDSAIEGYFVNDKGAVDKAAATRFRQYLASQPVEVPGVGEMSMAEIAAKDPEAAYRMLPGVVANYAGQQALEAREGGLLPPTAAKGIRGLQSGDRVGLMEGAWGRLTGKQAIDFGGGRVVPIDDIPEGLRHLIKSNYAQ